MIRASHRSINRFFFTPSTDKPISNGSVVDAYFFSPLLKCLSLAVCCKQAIISFVIGLNFHYYPATIFRSVIPIIVNSVNAVIERWSITHIIKEVIKRLKPAIANSYASTAIMFKTFFILIKASGFHRVVSEIFRSAVQSVLGKSFGSNFVIPAPARFCVAGSKIVELNGNRIATLTDTIPDSTSAIGFIRCSGYYGKTVEFLTDSVDNFRHKLLSAKVTLIRYVAVIQRNHFQPLSLATGVL